MNPSFRRLWLGQSVSLIGSQVAQLALPLIAVVQLHASVASIGLLSLVGFLPFVLLSVPVGSWADRWPRRPVLVVTNLARAALIAGVALLAASGRLRLADLFVLSAVSGALGLLFIVSFRASIPELVGTDQLVAAESRLAGSQTVASIAGPGLGGLLIAVASAPFALATDAASFVVAAVAAHGMVKGSSRPGRPGRPGRLRDRGCDNGDTGREGLRGSAFEGLRLIAGHPLLRALAAEGAIANLCGTMVTTLFIVFAVRTLSLGATAIGLIMATGGFGALAGATWAGRLGGRLGTGRLCLLALAVADASLLALPAVSGRGAAAAWMLAPMVSVGAAATAVFEIHTSALTLGATPPNLHGRTQAGLRFVGSFGLVGGALLGGVLGQVLGLRVALLTAALIGLGHWPVVLGSPLAGQGGKMGESSLGSSPYYSEASISSLG